MWNLLTRVRRHTWRPGARYGRFGVTGAFSVSALVVILIAGWIIDQRGASAADQRLAELARRASDPPLDLVARAARANRLVFLSDVPNSSSAKQFAAQAVERMATTSGLDALVVEVGEDEQVYLDQYFDRDREDASVLLSHTRALGAQGVAARAYLDILRTVWRLNQQMGPDQRIRVIAADLSGWPAASPLSPGEAARLLTYRDAHMQNAIDDFLNTVPNGRVLIFMNGLHGLRSGAVTVRIGGSAAISITPLAARLAQTREEVFTILVDAPAAAASSGNLMPYVGTRVAEILDRAGVRRRFGAVVTSAFDHVRQPVVTTKRPGIEFDITPRDYRLRDVADAYINLGY